MQVVIKCFYLFPLGIKILQELYFIAV